ARRSLRPERLLQRCDDAVCSFRQQYVIPRRLGFQTARTNHIKLDCALHTYDRAKKAKSGEEGKNVLAFFATLCLFRFPLLRNWLRSKFRPTHNVETLVQRLARAAARPSHRSADCLRARRCADIA